MRFRRYRALGQRCVVLYGGDHDAAGVPMSDDHDRRLNEDFQVRAEIERVALNLDQVRQYGLPPNPVKELGVRQEGQALHRAIRSRVLGDRGAGPDRATGPDRAGDPEASRPGAFRGAPEAGEPDGRRVLRKQAQNQPLIEELMKVGQPTLDKAARNVPAVERFLRTLLTLDIAAVTRRLDTGAVMKWSVGVVLASASSVPLPSIPSASSSPGLRQRLNSSFAFAAPALPLNRTDREKVASPRGFEPPTSGLGNRCSRKPTRNGRI